MNLSRLAIFLLLNTTAVTTHAQTPPVNSGGGSVAAPESVTIPTIEPGSILGLPPEAAPDTTKVANGQVTTFIELGSDVLMTAAVPVPSVTVTPRTKVVFSLSPDIFPTYTDLTWHSIGGHIGARTGRLEIGSADLTAAGVYWASLKVNGRPVESQRIFLRVADGKHLPLLALSVRGRVSGDHSPMIAGLAVGSHAEGTLSGNKIVLLRAVGPSLTQFGVTDALTQPAIKIFKADGSEFKGRFIFLSNGLSEEAANRRAAVRAGTFPLPAGSKDVSLLVALPPGAYTVQASSADGSAGTVLLDVYEVPEGTFLTNMVLPSS